MIGIDTRAMMRRQVQSRLLVFVLLLAVGLGAVVSVVQAGEMAFGMALAGTAQGTDAGGCGSCDDGKDAQTTADCAATCHLTAGNLVEAASIIDCADIHRFRMDRPRTARPSVPGIDPSPPKPLLG